MTSPPSTKNPAPDSEALLRSEVVSHLERGDTPRACQAARTLLLTSPTLRSARALRNALETHVERNPLLKPVRIGLLSSFSSEFLHNDLIARGLASGLALDIYQGGFGLFRQEILDPDSALYRREPTVVLLAAEGEDWVPEAYRDFLRLSAADFDTVVSRFRDEANALLSAFRGRCNAPVVVHNFAPPIYLAAGGLDAKQPKGQQELIRRLNDALADVSRTITGVHLLDYAALVGRHGSVHWYDARMRHFARAPIAANMQTHLAAEHLKYLRALNGLSKKCLILDLDNTLWGGVLGEEGPLGVQLGSTYPGSAFVEFQHRLLDLHARGVILAVASKNNPSDVDEIFQANTAMVLNKSHFAEMQVHWNSKTVSLTEIARRLNIGLEHCVFADDNPVECEEVRRSLPTVTVMELPPQPERYSEVLLQEGLFDTLGLTDEDRRRGELYRQRAEAESLRANIGSVEDYYRDLQMELSLTAVDRISLPRAAQLTQKTNQFTATTRRYSEAEVERRASDANWIVTSVGVRDRFGDNGIVGLVMAHCEDGALDVDTFLLSCRVIGRGVETAMLAHLCDRARAADARALSATVIPTSKNEPVRDLFARHGFVKVSEETDGTTRWTLDLTESEVAWPDWFTADQTRSPHLEMNS